jgi:hypothetical protein
MRGISFVILPRTDHVRHLFVLQSLSLLSLFLTLAAAQHSSSSTQRRSDSGTGGSTPARTSVHALTVIRVLLHAAR